jgi:hypothetical protein
MSTEAASQESLPGLDTLSLAIKRYAASVGVVEGAGAQKEADRTWIKIAQDTAWKQFCDRAMPARQATWGVVAAALRDIPPHKWSVVGGSAGATLNGEWGFATLREEGNSMVRLVTTVKTETLFNDLPGEVRQADSYLKTPKRGTECPNEMLGVQAEGKPRKRMLPIAGLHRVYLRARQDAAVDNVRSLNATVTASILGSDVEPKQLSRVGILSEWHNPNVRPIYLQTRHADSVIRDFNNPGFRMDGQEQDMNPNTLMQFLDSRAAERDYAYEQLTAIATILSESTPA